jgi:uncharacterized protein YndB with AHSA1/START domain
MKHPISALVAFLMVLSSAFVVRAQDAQPDVALEVVNEVIVRRPIADVFQYATTAKNWQKWHPNTLATSGDDGHSAKAGEKIVEYIRTGPIPTGVFHWVVLENTPEAKWQLTGGTEDGSIKFLLTYTFASTRDGQTRFRRELLVLRGPKNDLSELAEVMYQLMDPYLRLSSQLALMKFKSVMEGPKWAW